MIDYSTRDRVVQLSEVYALSRPIIAERLGMCRGHINDLYAAAKFEPTFGIDPYALKRRCPHCDRAMYVHRVQKKTPTIMFRCDKCRKTFRELVKLQTTGGSSA